MPSGNPLTTPKIATPYCNYIDLQNIKDNVVFTTCIWYQIEVNQYIYIKVIHGILLPEFKVNTVNIIYQL